jgi:NAD(P)-dependent dehydrogenase (short-subunit alcohol dehydrogenase family)
MRESKPHKSAKPVAVVTGGNRGLGYETCKQLAQAGYKVILTARDIDKARTAVQQLRTEHPDIEPPEPFQLDVTRPEQAAELEKFLRNNYGGRLDALINNAGAVFDSTESDAGILDTDADILRRSFENNTLSAFHVTRALLPLMQARNYGRIVNVSSGMGALTDMNGGWPGYRISKTALNALTRIFANELQGTNIKINSVCPGWVRTDMGGPNATRDVEQGVTTTIWLATLPDRGPSGGFYRDKKPIPW